MNESSETPRKPGKLRKALAIGAAAAAIGGVGLGVNKLLEPNSNSPTYQTFKMDESTGYDYWQEQIRSQFKPGDTVNLVDLVIHVNNGELNARYTPIVVNAEDGIPGNLGAVFEAGSSFIVRDAPIIQGSVVDPLRRDQNKWVMISGDNIDLPGQILYIFLGDQTEDYVSTVRPHEATFTMFSEKGEIIASDSGNVVVAPGATQPNPIQLPDING